MSAPLRRSIAIAAAARVAMASGITLDKAFAAASAKASAEERSAALSVTYAATRRAIAAGEVLRLLCDREPAPAVESLLATAIALLIEDDEKPYTVVSEAVAAARLRRPTERAAGFVNGCLRTFCRSREEILRRAFGSREARFNAPHWWIEELEKSLGAETAGRVLALQGTKPPLVLRINRRRISREDWMREAASSGIEALPLGLDGVLLPKALPVSAIPGFADGLASVQDAGAQLAAQFLAPQDGERILDACAAPGGKTAHILEIADAGVTALEKDPAREPRIGGNLSRLGLQAKSLCRDAADTASWWDGMPFDAILLDAPCTASGIVRRHPDIVFSRRRCDIFSLARQQKALLDALWPCVRIGGRLLYAVCSVFREEGPMQAASFLREHPDASPGTLARGLGGTLSLVPQEAGAGTENTVIPRIHDGFFYALFVKGAE